MLESKSSDSSAPVKLNLFPYFLAFCGALFLGFLLRLDLKIPALLYEVRLYPRTWRYGRQHLTNSAHATLWKKPTKNIQEKLSKILKTVFMCCVVPLSIVSYVPGLVLARKFVGELFNYIKPCLYFKLFEKSEYTVW